MKRRIKKSEKIKILVYIGMLVFLIKIICWMGPEQIKAQTGRKGCELLHSFFLSAMKDCDAVVSFATKGEKEILQRVLESANKSNSVYGYVEYTYSKNHLVAYEPEEKVEKEETSSLFFAKTEETTEKESETEPETQPETVGVQEVETGQVQEALAPVFSVEQLRDYEFLRSSLYIVPERASVLPQDLDADTLLAKNMSIVKDASVPQILIYHTHGSETFADSTQDLQNTGIIAVGSRLAEELSVKYGYNVIHCTEIFDNVNGVFDRSKAYDYSRAAVQQILTDHPDIQVIIDLHRDGVREDLHLVTDINGKPTAKIMFFNGVSRSSAKGDLEYLYNRYRSDNLSFSLQAKLEALAKYPEFTRKNYIDAYQYNLDLLPRAMLIEAGAQTNTLQEELNAMECLADILDSVLSGNSRRNLGLES